VEKNKRGVPLEKSKNKDMMRIMIQTEQNELAVARIIIQTRIMKLRT